MSFYPEKINKLFNAPTKAGNLENADAHGVSASFVCGSFVRFFLQIETQTIKNAKFKTNGCGFTVAAAEVLAGKIIGKQLADFHGFDKNRLKRDIETDLDKFGEHRKHCLEICVDALQNAFADYRKVQLEEFHGEKALICTCFGVAEETIETLIETENAESIEEIGELCNAGTGCGSCQFLIQELIDASWREKMPDYK